MNELDKLRAELEPDAVSVAVSLEGMLYASQAISLRRIADSMEKLDKRLAEIRGEIGHGAL